MESPTINFNSQTPSPWVEYVKSCDSVSEVANRIFESSFFFAFASLTVLTVTSVSVLTGSISLVPFGLIGFILGIGLAQQVDLNKLVCEASFLKTFYNYYFTDLGWHDEILEGKLTLGAMPLKNYIDIKGGAVLSMLEEHEFDSPLLFGTPATPEHWENKGMDQLNIATPDFVPISQEKIEEAVEFLHDQIDIQQKHAYVHCKAGVGRSATIVICYLLKHHSDKVCPQSSKMEADVAAAEEAVTQAVDFVKARRPQINIGPKQIKAITTFYNGC